MSSILINRRLISSLISWGYFRRFKVCFKNVTIGDDEKMPPSVVVSCSWVFQIQFFKYFFLPELRVLLYLRICLSRYLDQDRTKDLFGLQVKLPRYFLSNHSEVDASR